MIEDEYKEEFKHKGVNLEVIRLDKKDKEAAWLHSLVKEFYDVALDSFGKLLPYDAIDSRTRVSDLLFVLRDENGRTIGYAVNEKILLDGSDVNYFSSGFVRREIGKKGCYSLLNKVRIAILPTDVVMTRTQNPVVYRKFAEVARGFGYKVYPNGTAEMPMKVMQIAKEFSPNVSEELIVPEVYNFGEGGRSLMDDTPEPESELERRIWQNLRVDKGDAVIIAGIMG